jgi:hypothetical protein
VTGLSAWVGTAVTDVTLLQQILIEGSTWRTSSEVELKPN